MCLQIQDFCCNNWVLWSSWRTIQQITHQRRDHPPFPFPFPSRVTGLRGPAHTPQPPPAVGSWRPWWQTLVSWDHTDNQDAQQVHGGTSLAVTRSPEIRLYFQFSTIPFRQGSFTTTSKTSLTRCNAHSGVRASHTPPYLSPLTFWGGRHIVISTLPCGEPLRQGQIESSGDSNPILFDSWVHVFNLHSLHSQTEFPFGLGGPSS